MDKFVEIIKRCRLGDKEAQEELLISVKPLILKTVSLLHCDAENRKDMIQEGYIITLKTIKSYDEGKSIPYLAYLKVALHYGIYQKSKFDKCYSLNEMIAEDVELIDCLVDEDCDINEIMIKKDEYESLHKAIYNLNPNQRMIIIEKFFKGRKLGEIAENTGKQTISIVKAKERAIKNLRMYLAANPNGIDKSI